jgi:hypothetical protein
MGIFGTTCPRFIYNHGGGGEVTVDLTYGIIQRSEPTTDYVEQRSAITGDRDLLARGTHWEVEVKYHLYKHTTAPTPAGKYSTIATYKGRLVTLYLHADGAPFYKTGTTDALFVLKEITPFFLTTTDYKDGLILLFVSADTVLQA